MSFQTMHAAFIRAQILAKREAYARSRAARYQGNPDPRALHLYRKALHDMRIHSDALHRLCNGGEVQS